MQRRLTGGEIVHKDEGQHLAFGYLYVAKDKDGEQVVDHSREVVEPADLEKAAYEYVETSRTTGEMHTRPNVARLVESFVLTPEKARAMGILDECPACKAKLVQVPKVAHWIGLHVTEASTWNKIKSGVLRMFSLGGTARREAA